MRLLAGNAVEPDERRSADGAENIGMDGHGRDQVCMCERVYDTDRSPASQPCASGQTCIPYRYNRVFKAYRPSSVWQEFFWHRRM